MADTDIFYRIFGKPTLIYKYLRTQHLVSPLFLHRNLSYIKTRQGQKKLRSKFRLETFHAVKQNTLGSGKEHYLDLELVILGIEQLPENGVNAVFKMDVLAKTLSKEVALNSLTVRSKGPSPPLIISASELRKEGFDNVESVQIMLRVTPEVPEKAEPDSKRVRMDSWSSVVKPFTPAFSSNGEYHFPLREITAAVVNSGTFKDKSFDEMPYLKTKLRWRKKSSPCASSKSEEEENKENLNQDRKKKILYYYNAGSHSVQTQAMFGYICPWCAVDGRNLAGLLMHLKNNHFRFKFVHAEKTEYHLVEVSANELFDGSFSGNPQRAALHPSSNRRKRPLKCLMKTEVIVWNSKKFRQAGEVDDDSEHQRPSVFGHQRLYYRTATCMPIGSEGIDVDSEGEIDPEWLQTKTKMMIDEFTDVNPGEKEMWKMWNLFKMRHNFVGDKQMAFALYQFISSMGLTVAKADLIRNFLVHLSGFFDFGVTTQYSTFRSVSDLRSLFLKNPDLRKQFAECVQKQVEFKKNNIRSESADL